MISKFTNFWTPIDSNVSAGIGDELGNANIVKCTAATLPTGAGFAVGCLGLATDTGLLYYNTGTTSVASFTAVNAGAAALTIPSSFTDSATTNGNSFRVLTTAGTFTTGGSAIKADLAAGTAGNGLVAITTGSYSGTGLLLVSGVSTTSGTLIYAPSMEGTVTTGKYLNLGGVFTVSKYGATVIAGTAAATAALTLTAGDLVLTSGNGILTSGNLTLTSGNLVLTAGNATLTSGNLTLTSGNITLTANASTITSTGTGANGMVLANLKNSANTTVSGTAKTVAITIGGVAYYFLVYPTSTA